MRFSLSLLLLAIMIGQSASGIAVAQRPVPTLSPQAREEALKLLHDGRFDAAERSLVEAVRQQGENGASAFFRSFVTYWRLLYDLQNEQLREEFENRLDRTLELAGDELDRDNNWESALWMGSTYLLRAQLRAWQKKALKAGYDAKKSNKNLRRAAKWGSGHAESDFGLGTYQYFAAKLPAIVKMLRVFLAIPGGDREEGLERLERASRSSKVFALEARIVLSRIYVDDDERMYDEAVEQVEQALVQFPDSIAALQAAALIDIDLMWMDRALDRLERARLKAAELGDVAPSVVVALHYYASQAELGRFRPDRALQQLRPLLEAFDTVPTHLRNNVAANAGMALQLMSVRPAWLDGVPASAVRAPTDKQAELARYKAAAAALRLAHDALEHERLGQVERAGAIYANLMQHHHDSMHLELLYGRHLLLSGRPDDARPILLRVAGSDVLPQPWIGASRLYAGLVTEWGGSRESAVDWYRAAEKAPWFRGREAARMCLERPCTLQDVNGFDVEPPQRANGSTH